jgi:hypothetical protein
MVNLAYNSFIELRKERNMEYCPICGTHSDLCDDEAHEHVEACYCNNCGSIGSEEELDYNAHCDDCVRALEEEE